MSYGNQAPARSASPSRAWSDRFRLLVPTFLGGVLLAACGNDATRTGGQVGTVGEMRVNPDTGGAFLVDFNEGGKAGRLSIAEASWGRLVDVYAMAPGGGPTAAPVFRDFVVGQDVMTDADFELDTNPVTLETRLTVQRMQSDPEFLELLEDAASGLVPIIAANDDGTAAGAISDVPRNATVVLRFNDALQDNDAARDALLDNVKVVTGYTPSVPFDARVLFDPNHGAFLKGAFHSTRILVDMTVSQTEANDMLIPLEVNGIGLPASNDASDEPNVSIRIPSKVLQGAGQFTVLRSLSGVPIDSGGDDPVTSNTATADVVRAFRSGNADQVNNGFLADLEAPRILGTWPLLITNVANGADVGYDFVLEVMFTTVCQDVLAEGTVLRSGAHFLEVTADSAAPDMSGVVSGVMVRNLAEDAIGGGGTVLLGSASFLSPYDTASLVDIGCWVTFTPPAKGPPTTQVETTSVVSLRFNEPMDPVQVTALDTFLVVEGNQGTAPTPENITVGIVQASPNLENYSFTPALPFHHEQGTEETFHIAFDQVPRDLAGNPIVDQLPKIEFTIDPAEATSDSGGLTFRFNSLDEMEPISSDPINDPELDVRGQVFYDLAKGTIRPRTTVYQSHVSDRTQPVQALMTTFGAGVKEPLVPLGSRLMTVWRHCDFGWVSDDETKHNLDVIGLSWAPTNGIVVGDFFPEFQIQLSHATRTADSGVLTGGTVRFPSSGLLSPPATFDSNALIAPDTAPVIVHQRSVGYRISPFDRFTSSTGTLMMPFPMNRVGGPLQSFLWRDTGSTAKGDPDLANNNGVPLQIETSVAGNANLTPAPNPNKNIYYVVEPGEEVPTIALPLLMEFRCYPTSNAVGLNSLDASLASTTLMGMRAFSSGGTDSSGNAVARNPDGQITPAGGFNPGGFNPGTGGGATLPVDQIFYMGQIDTVVRISRAHTIWLDTETIPSVGADYSPAIIEPDPTFFPNGTSLQLAFRGATGFNGAAQLNTDIPRRSSNIDFYGDLRTEDEGGEDGGVDYLNDFSDWSQDISDIDGARYIQVRLTFVNNIESRLNAEISALGIPFLRN